jgi:hypothetical protein
LTCLSARPKIPGILAALGSVFQLRSSLVADWQYAQSDRSEQLAQISYYSAKKHENGREIEFRITVKEFVSPPPGQHTRFFAEADKKVNQKSTALLPFGWGDSVLKALAGCLRMIRDFPYEVD